MTLQAVALAIRRDSVVYLVLPLLLVPLVASVHLYYLHIAKDGVKMSLWSGTYMSREVVASNLQPHVASNHLQKYPAVEKGVVGLFQDRLTFSTSRGAKVFWAAEVESINEVPALFSSTLKLNLVSGDAIQVRLRYRSLVRAIQRLNSGSNAIKGIGP